MVKEMGKKSFEKEKPGRPQRSESELDEQVIDYACEDAWVTSCKRKVGKEMFAKGTLPSTHKNTRPCMSQFYNVNQVS